MLENSPKLLILKGVIRNGVKDNLLLPEFHYTPSKLYSYPSLDGSIPSS